MPWKAPTTLASRRTYRRLLRHHGQAGAAFATACADASRSGGRALGAAACWRNSTTTCCATLASIARVFGRKRESGSGNPERRSASILRAVAGMPGRAGLLSWRGPAAAWPSVSMSVKGEAIDVADQQVQSQWVNAGAHPPKRSARAGRPQKAGTKSRQASAF